MTDQINTQEINAIIDKLAKILATGLGQEQRERVLQGVTHHWVPSSKTNEKSIFEALKTEFKTSGSLDFVLILTERIRSTRSFYQDVGVDLEQLELLLSKYHLRTSIAPRNVPYVFVLMPFNDSFRVIYEESIRPTLRDDLGCIVENADELHTTNQIIEDIFSQIRNADFLVADTTGKNPNVFYELGYAHALGKKVILLAQDAKDLPFDVKGLRHIIYRSESHATLKSHLKQTAKVIVDSLFGSGSS